MHPPRAGGIILSGLSVREWSCEYASESVRPENLVNTIYRKTMKGISHRFGHRRIWLHGCAD